MLQQTRIKTVLSCYREFLEHFPDVKRLAATNLQAVLRIREGLGYYARARNLHGTAQKVVIEFHGKIPTRWEDFGKLTGVGNSTAAAVLSIAFNQPWVSLPRR